MKKIIAISFFLWLPIAFAETTVAQQYVMSDPAPVSASLPQQPVVANAIPAAPTSASTPAPTSIPTATMSATPSFTDAERQTWLTNCFAAVQDKKAQGYAEQFCNCGWQHIVAGEISREQLTATTPPLDKERDSRMRVISQVCGVELMAKLQH